MGQIQIPTQPIDQFQTILYLLIGLYKIKGLDVSIFPKLDGSWQIVIATEESPDAPVE